MRNSTIQRGLERAGFARLPFMAPSLQSVVNGTSFRLSWLGEIGREYQVEYAPDLFHWRASPAGWVTAEATTVTWEDQGPPTTELPPASVPARFYRVFRLGTP